MVCVFMVDANGVNTASDEASGARTKGSKGNLFEIAGGAEGEEIGFRAGCVCVGCCHIEDDDQDRPADKENAAPNGNVQPPTHQAGAHQTLERAEDERARDGQCGSAMLMRIVSMMGSHDKQTSQMSAG